MGFFDWLFGDGEGEGEGGADMIEVLDEQGEEMMVPRDQYAEEVLPKQLAQADDDPEALYGVVRRALDEGFAEECLEAAERLREVDDNPERGATILGLTYWKLGRLDEAEQVYRDYVDEHGESGIVVTNLAKIHAERGETDRAKEVLWEAIELAPNLQNAVDMWVNLHCDGAEEEDVEQTYRSSLLEIAGLEEAWYARGLLAQFCLEHDEDERGLEYAREVAEMAGDEPGALMTVTGPLGEHGFTEEMVEWFGEAFDPDVHNPYAGLNLARACVETDNEELGRALVEKLEDYPHSDVRESIEEVRKALD